MTLERSGSYPDFLFRRWLRLFPAMLFCSVLLFLTAPLFPARPAGTPELIDLLPGLTFIDGRLWGLAFGIPPPLLEGAFWSLYVEIKIYLLFGFLYFQFGSRAAIVGITCCFFMGTVLLPLFSLPPTFQIAANLFFKMLSAEHYGWFSAGALLYKYWRERRAGDFVAALLIGVFSALYVKETGIGPKMAALIMVALFVAAVLIQRLRTRLAHPVLLGAGFISYPLFLLHENMAVAMIVQLGHAAPWLPAILQPVLPIASTVALSWLVATYCEPWMQAYLRARMTWVSKVFQP